MATRIGGVPIRRTTFSQAVHDFLAEARSDGRAQAYRLINAYSLALADGDPEYRHLLASYGCNLPDGRPLALGLQLLDGHDAAEQVRGPSFFSEALDRGQDLGIRHFFLGGDDDTLQALVASARQRFPRLEIAGSWSPPFRPLTAEERRQQDEMLRGSGAHVVWVGLGTPKQDFEAQRIVESVGLTAAGVGAAFGFLAGTQAEAPRWMGALGVEWLYRLATEPRRLWRRYLFGNTRFMLILLRELMATYANRRRS